MLRPAPAAPAAAAGARRALPVAARSSHQTCRLPPGPGAALRLLSRCRRLSPRCPTSATSRRKSGRSSWPSWTARRRKRRRSNPCSSKGGRVPSPSPASGAARPGGMAERSGMAGPGRAAGSRHSGGDGARPGPARSRGPRLAALLGGSGGGRGSASPGAGGGTALNMAAQVPSSPGACRRQEGGSRAEAALGGGGLREGARQTAGGRRRHCPALAGPLGPRLRPSRRVGLPQPPSSSDNVSAARPRPAALSKREPAAVLQHREPSGGAAPAAPGLVLRGLPRAESGPAERCRASPAGGGRTRELSPRRGADPCLPEKERFARFVGTALSGAARLKHRAPLSYQTPAS